MLDLHRLNDQYISELWYAPNDDRFTSDTFFQTWFTILDRYKDRTNLVAVDLLNEPHGRATWGSNDPSIPPLSSMLVKKMEPFVIDPNQFISETSPGRIFKGGETAARKTLEKDFSNFCMTQSQSFNPFRCSSIS